MSPEQIKQGYSNAAEVAVRQAELAAERREEQAGLRIEARAESAAVISELVEGVVEEASRTLPFADKDGPTGGDVAEANGNMASVMDTALAASSAAHAVRAASRVPELPRHSALVEQAVDAILDLPAEDAEDATSKSPRPSPRTKVTSSMSLHGYRKSSRKRKRPNGPRSTEDEAS
jgi:hypothetical protein